MKTKRTVTAKVTAANRKNADRSPGPKTERGKNNSRFNALGRGLFSQQLVIEAIGEREEDLDTLRAQVWAYFKPVNIVEAMLAAKFVDSWWRWLRIRRSEDAEVRRTVLQVSLAEDVRRAAQVYSLKNRFDQLFAARINTLAVPAEGRAEVERKRHTELLQISLNLLRIADRDPSAGLDAYPGLEDAVSCVELNGQAWKQRDRNPAVEDAARAAGEIEASLEEVRSQLASTAEGLRFLKDTASLVLAEVEKQGALSDTYLILLQACCGAEDHAYTRCLDVNSILRKGKKTSAPISPDESGTATPEGTRYSSDREPGEGAGEVTMEEAGRLLLRSCVEMIISRLDIDGQRAAAIQVEETRLKTAAAGLLPPDALSRVSRAEAPVDRQFNQALVLLLALKNPAVDPRLLPKSRR
jgi:hypothetical protein